MKDKLMPMEKLLPFDEALAALLGRLDWALKTENARVADALGRVLREAVVSPLDIPPFDKSAMDGYAVIAADTAAAGKTVPIRLEVLEDLPAGTAPKKKLGHGQASRIMTGAPLPPGADAVVMVEDTRKGEGAVEIFRPATAGDNMGRRGEDVREGATVFSSGTRIGAAEMGMLAALGRTRVKVSRRPKVAVISTGDEVEAPGRKLKPGRIFDANQYALGGLALRLGCEVEFMGIARDRVEAIEKKLKDARRADVVLLTGGVSVGDYDLMADILPTVGVEKIWHGVRVQPGKPTYAGVRGQTLYFGLPGNPVSCLVCFELFARPALEKMMGLADLGLRRGRAILADDAKTKPGRRKFLRAQVVNEGPEIKVKIYRDQKSGVLTSMLLADCLVDVPGETAVLPAGEAVNVLWLKG